MPHGQHHAIVPGITSFSRSTTRLNEFNWPQQRAEISTMRSTARECIRGQWPGTIECLPDCSSIRWSWDRSHHLYNSPSTLPFNTQALSRRPFNNPNIDSLVVPPVIYFSTMRSTARECIRGQWPGTIECLPDCSSIQQGARHPATWSTPCYCSWDHFLQSIHNEIERV
jgi:hypothetical protein